MSVQESEETFEVDEVSGGDNNESNSSPDTLRILEALLFASDELMTAAKLKTILPGNPDARQIRKMADKINVQLQKERHPFEIVEIGGGYQFRTVSFYHTWVRQIFKEKASKRLSVQALECLAIIAYKQPLSKAEIEAIRGVVSDGAMKTLLEKHLVVISGRSEKPGRPLLYATSSEFLKYFGLNKIADLPRIEEFEAIAREKMDELSIEELSQNEEKTADIELDEESLSTAQIDSPSAAEKNQTIDNGEIKNADPVIPEPQATAVFEVTIDDDMGSEDDIADMQSPDSADDEVMDFVDSDAPVESSEISNEQKNSSQIEGSDGNTDTFDLEISFDSEDVEEMLPSELSAIASTAQEKKELDEESEPEIFEQNAHPGDSAKPPEKENGSSGEEEMLEIFLPDDSIDDDEKK